MIYFRYPITWYGTIFTFVLGIAWSIYEIKIENVLKISKRRYIVSLVSFILFLICSILNKITRLDIIMSLSMIFFVITTILFVYRIRMNFFITQFLGRNSLGIYVMQGLFLKGIKNNGKNLSLYCIEVIIGTLITAILFHKIQEKIYKIMKGRLIWK